MTTRQALSIRRLQRATGSAIVLGLASCLLAGPAQAGTGSVTAGKLDLTVLFTYQEPDPASWEPVFTAFSGLLLNATEGGLQLGTVTFSQNARQAASADIWILPDDSGARAHQSGLGVPGRHIFLSQIHKDTTGNVLGQFALAHEAGHYLFGLRDEYRGFVGFDEATRPAHYCAATASSVACIMDGGSALSPNQLRTEFCTRASDDFPSTRHNIGVTNGAGEGVRTAQEQLVGVSCWEQMEASEVGQLLHPTSEPTTAQPAASAVTFQHDAMHPAIALILDRSPSVWNSLNQEKESAKALLRLLPDGSSFSLVSFGGMNQIGFGDVRLDVPLQTLDDALRSSVDQTIDSLITGGQGLTSPLCDALTLAASELAQSRSEEKLIYFITAGVGDGCQVDDPTLLALLAASGIRVAALALGTETLESSLATLAAATGGEMLAAPQPDDLTAALVTSAARTLGTETVIESTGGMLAPGAITQETFEVEPFAAVLRLSLTFPSGMSPSWQVMQPDGSIVNFNNPRSGVLATETGNQRILEFPLPEAGTWEAILSTPQNLTAYDLVGYVERRALSITVQAPDAPVTFPDPIDLKVSVVAETPVAGAMVTADVLRPDGSTQAFRLFDTGEPEHGDEFAGDGVYSGRFTNYAGSGLYQFDLTVDNVDGMASLAVAEEGAQATAVTPFSSTTTVLASQVGQLGNPFIATVLLTDSSTFTAPAAAIPKEAPETTEIAAFSLDIGPSEPAFLDTATFNITSATGEFDGLPELALHLDADADGQVDPGSLPLALTRPQAGDTQVSFGRAGVPLTLLDAGSRAGFVVSLGTAVEETAAALPPATTFRPPATRWPLLITLLLGCAAAIAVLSTGRQTVGRSRVAPRLAWSACGLLLMLATTPGCAPDAPSGTVSVTALTTPVSLTLVPSDVGLRGAVTGRSASVTGLPQSFLVELQ